MKLNDSATVREITELAKRIIINSLCYGAGLIVLLLDKESKK